VDVQVILHLELTPDLARLWWAESPEIPGFSATASSVPELTRLTIEALDDIARERGDADGATCSWLLAGALEINSGSGQRAITTGSDETPAAAGANVRQMEHTVLQEA
jgi:hypothetical protein